MRNVILLSATLLLATLAGCLATDDASTDPPMVNDPAMDEATNPIPGGNVIIGENNLAGEAPALRFSIHDIGAAAPEPSIGVTSSGCIFVPALEQMRRSCDSGATWESVEQVPQCQPGTSDPYGWVDPVTDRVFLVQMVSLVTTWICWSDDDGETWLGNPYDSGPLPVNDHIKLATGPYTASGYGLIGTASSILYDQATYFCYNKLAGVFCYTSFDGGMTFPIGGQVVGLATTGAGLHGAIEAAPDGTVYVEPRVATPTVIYSKDNGLTWTSVEMGQDVGTPNPRKNSEVATDASSNAYHVWTDGDMGVSMARSFDSGVTFEQTSIKVTPDRIISTTFPHIDAGDDGRIAITYLGSEDADMLGTEDIDGNPWDGNPHTAPSQGVNYFVYVTMSTNADEENPTFTTVRVTPDPVQIGSICISSGDCRDIGGSNRNLLDFNDLHIDREGRVHIAYADGCTGACAADWQNLDATASRDRAGYVAILRDGPLLFEN